MSDKKLHMTEEFISDVKYFGSLKEAYMAHADEALAHGHDPEPGVDYGIGNIDTLFPDAHELQTKLETIYTVQDPDDWHHAVLKGVSHTPFSRIKSTFMRLDDSDQAEADRAKGYIKTHEKVENVIGLMNRETSPTTVYVKQKLDRDDILDITDWDIVTYLKAELRLQLEKELARAILYGDGRSAVSEYKISETAIRPIAKDTDNNFYTIAKTFTVPTDNGTGVVSINDKNDEARTFIRSVLENRHEYRGSSPVMFISPRLLTSMLLMEDGLGHRMYKNESELAQALMVQRFYRVPEADIASFNFPAAVLVDLKDYTVATDKGGAIAMFDDFDIDYNQYKYMMETRFAGSLMRPYTAMVFTEAYTTRPSGGGGGTDDRFEFFDYEFAYDKEAGGATMDITEAQFNEIKNALEHDKTTFVHATVVSLDGSLAAKVVILVSAFTEANDMIIIAGEHVQHTAWIDDSELNHTIVNMMITKHEPTGNLEAKLTMADVDNEII